MAYTVVHISLDPVTPEYSEILFALLDAYSFEGIQENENSIDTFIASDKFNPEHIALIQSSLLAIGCRMHWVTEEIADQNWNSLWESNFQPVIIDTRCVIRAPFHSEFTNIRYQITIEPKMAFGTGHHPTTHNMIEHMLEIDFTGKKVLDMGCGTGILGILASLMGAERVVAIDNDSWAYQNTLENASKNYVHNLQALHGDNKDIPDETFDIILANINRNILLTHLDDYSRHLHPMGLLLISGIIEEDRESVENKANETGFELKSSQLLNSWATMLFVRK